MKPMTPAARYTIITAPAVLMLLCLSGLLISPWKSFTLWMLKENHPVELLTFLFLFMASLLGILLVKTARHNGEPAWVSIFLGFITLALFIVAMEEIAWGQWFFGFQTPDILKEVNRQGETTLHNIGDLQGSTEILRVIFGYGGIIGILFTRIQVLRPVAVPAILASWFVIIAVHASIDLINDYYSLGRGFDWVMMKSSEFLEMIIGLAGLLYIWLHWRERVITKD